jgi:antitoxin (DNA-binding transcriptional repressor) of toxin-antitoxin stability system
VTDEPRITVANSELHTVREAMRHLNLLVDQIITGEAEKIVLTKRGRMCAVILSVAAYGQLSAPASGAPSTHASHAR